MSFSFKIVDGGQLQWPIFEHVYNNNNNNNNNNRLVPTKGALSQREALDTIDPQTGSADVLPWNKFRIQQV
jgi:hypothetical protein